MQADAALALLLHRLERLRPRHEQHRREFERAFRAPVQRGPGLVVGVGDVVVELLRGFRRDLALGLAPQRGALVGGHFLAVAHDHDRQRDVVGPFAHDRLEAVALEELGGVVAHVEHDVGAGLRARRRRDRVGALAVGRPAPGLLRPCLPRRDLDALGHHERGVEPHAELADQARPLLRLGAFQRLAEGARARPRDGAEVGHHVVARHADAVVRQRDGLAVRVRRDPDLGTLGEGEGRLRQGLEPAAIRRVGRVGHELAKEDLAVGVERVDHQVEEASDLGPEFAFLLGDVRLAHCSFPVPRVAI